MPGVTPPTTHWDLIALGGAKASVSWRTPESSSVHRSCQGCSFAMNTWKSEEMHYIHACAVTNGHNHLESSSVESPTALIRCFVITCFFICWFWKHSYHYMDVRLDSLSILGLKGHMWPMWSWECGLKKIIFTEDMVVKTHSWFNDEHRQSSCKVLRAETQHSQRQKRDLQQTTFVKSLRPSSGQRKPRGARSRIMGARPGWSLAWRLCIIIIFSLLEGNLSDSFL